jgi:phospholipid/cholesterol/gamma-HCH transport system substrate-binding protein
MEDRTKQFRVGVVVFATMIITVLLILMNSDFSWSPFRSQYQLQLLVDQAPGVSPDTPVRRRGVLIGRVDKVQDTDEGALITMNIDSDKQIKSNEGARIQTSLIGDAVIEFAPLSPSEGAQPVPPGSIVRGTYNPTPLDLLANLQGDLRQTILSLGRAGDQVAELAERMNQVLGDQDAERINRLLGSTESAMANFGTAMENVNDIIGDEKFKQDFKEGLAQLPSVVSDAREIMGALERAVGSADENLKNLQGFTGPLGERGPVIVDSIERGVDNLSELLGETALLAKSINNSEGTFGKLIRDRELYDQMLMAMSQVNQLVANIEMMSRKLRPILDDVRVFTDKIARDPARIARGIIPQNRELPIK